MYVCVTEDSIVHLLRKARIVILPHGIMVEWGSNPWKTAQLNITSPQRPPRCGHSSLRLIFVEEFTV